MNASDRFSTSPDVLAQEVGGETVLLDLNSGTYFGLDAIGSRIWSLANEGKSLAEICDELLDEYDASRENVERDTSLLMEQLMLKGIISLK